MTSELMLLKPQWPEIDQILAHRRGLIAKMAQMTERLTGIGEQEDAVELLDMAATELLMMGQALALTYTREARLRAEASGSSTPSEVEPSQPPVTPTSPSERVIQEAFQLVEKPSSGQPPRRDREIETAPIRLPSP